MATQDQKINKNKIYDFLVQIDQDFPVPLSDKVNLLQYASKLWSKATLCSQVENGRIVGLVAGYTDNLSDDKAYIAIVGVVKEARHKKIAQKLIADFVNICSEKHISYVHLYTSAENIAAIGIYYNIGFKKMTINNEPRPNDVHLILEVSKKGGESNV